MSTYEDKLAELRKKYGLDGGGTAPAAPASQPSKGPASGGRAAELRKKYGLDAGSPAPPTAPVAPPQANPAQDRVGALRKKWGIEAPGAPVNVAPVNFAPVDEHQISPSTPDFGNVPMVATHLPTRPAGRARILEDGLNTDPANTFKYDFAKAGAEVGPVITAEDQARQNAEDIYRARQGGIKSDRAAYYTPTPEAQAATDAAAQVQAAAERTQRLADIKANPDWLFAAITEGRILPQDMQDVSAQSIPWKRLAQVPESPWYSIGQKGLADPEGARNDLLAKMQGRETTGYDVARAIKTAGADTLTFGAQPIDVQPQTAAGKAAFTGTQIVGGIAQMAAAGAVGGAAAEATAARMIPEAVRATEAGNLLLRGARGVGTGLALQGAKELAHVVDTGEVQPGAAGRIGREAAFFGILDTLMPSLGGATTQGVHGALPAAVRNTIAGRAVSAGAGGAVAGGTTSLIVNSLFHPENEEEASVWNRVLTDAVQIGLFGAARGALGSTETGFKTQPPQEVIGQQIGGRIYRGIPEAELATAHQAKGDLAQLGYTEFRPGSGVWQKRGADGTLVSEIHEDVMVNGRQVPKIVADRAARGAPQSAAKDATIPQGIPALPAPASEAAGRALALDRSVVLRNANPGMDERAILDMVKSTGNLSDQEFQGFAARAGKPEAAAPAQAPPVDRVAALREKHPGLSEAFIQKVAKTEERLAVVREKNPGISEESARDAVQLGDILSDGEFQRYAAMVVQPQESTTQPAPPQEAQPGALVTLRADKQVSEMTRGELTGLLEKLATKREMLGRDTTGASEETKARIRTTLNQDVQLVRNALAALKDTGAALPTPSAPPAARPTTEGGKPVSRQTVAELASTADTAVRTAKTGEPLIGKFFRAETKGRKDYRRGVFYSGQEYANGFNQDGLVDTGNVVVENVHLANPLVAPSKVYILDQWAKAGDTVAAKWVKPSEYWAKQGQDVPAYNHEAIPSMALVEKYMADKIRAAGHDGYVLTFEFEVVDLAGKGRAPMTTQSAAPPLPAAPTGEPVQAPTKPLPKMGDNYVKPLSTYSDTLYRETSARGAFPFIKESNATDQGAMNEVFLANTPNLALGQGDNRGILLEFDAGSLRGQVNTSKPAWQMAYDQGDAEFIGKSNGAPAYHESLRAVTVKPDAKMPKADKQKLTATLGAMEAQGWTKTTNADNSVTYRRPQSAAAVSAQPAPQAADNRTVSEAARPVVTGNTAIAKTERGTTIEAKYAVVDAGSLISSHDTGLRQDPRYPQELQPRDRSRMASEDQINRIVGGLEPSFLGASPKASEGAPIVGSDMVVESGNGRVIALKRAYESSHANSAKYKAWLMANADQFGLDPKVIEGTTSPVLVRIRQTQVDRAEFARQANEQSVAAMSATEQAMSDATKLEGGWMALFNPTDSGEIVHPGNRDFIRVFMDKVIGPSERGRYMTADGALSQEGINRIRNAVFAKAYGDPIAIEKLAESPDNNVRNITNGMLAAAGRVVQIKDGITDGRMHDLDISQEIAQAMQKLSELRESGQTVQQFLGQMNLFADELTPLAKDVLDVFDKNKRSGKKITAILMAYADVVEGAGDPRQASLFENTAPTLADVWEAAVRRSEESGSAEVQGSLFADPALRGAGPGEGSPQGGRGAPAAGQGQAEGQVTGPKGGTDAMRGGRPSLMPSGAAAPAQVDVVRRLDIVKFLDKAFVPIRTGGFRGVRGALGVFKIREKVVRTKLAEDLPVIAHEVGHHLDHELGLQDKAYDGELLALGRATSPPKADNAYLRKEGVAEFMRLYLTDPAAALKEAPGYHAAFEWQMQAHPDIQQTLLEARRMVDMWKNQSGKARILGAMSIGEKEAKRPITFTQLYASAVDELEPLRKFEQELAGGRKLSTEESPFLTAWLARGWAGKAEAFLNHGVLDEDYNKVGPGLKEILKPIDDLDDFRAYLIAKRAKDLATRENASAKTPEERVKNQIPLERSVGVGVTMQDVDQVIADGDAKFGAAQKALVQYQDAVLQELVKAGVIDAEGAKAMRSANEQYIPFFRVMDPSAGTFNFRGAKSFANLQNPVQRFKGSGRSIVDPLESIVKNTYALLNVAERNKVGRALVDLAEKTNGMGRLIEKVDAPMRPVQFQLDDIKGKLEDAGVDTDTIDLSQVAMIFEQTGTPSAAKNQITVFRNGKKEFYQVDEELYRAVLPMNSQSTEWYIKMWSYPASLLRAGAVLSPDFQANNPLKDQITAAVFSDYGYKPGVDLARGLFHVLGKSDLYYKWLASGGSQANMVSMDRESLKGALDALTNKPTVAGSLLFPLRHPIEALRAISEVMENATRLGEFARGVAKEGATGEGIRRASLGARDVTVDFSRSGSQTKGINKARAFFNASVQGTDKMLRAFKAHPFRTAARSLAYITLPTILLYLANRNNPWWQEKDEWQKDAFWFIPNPAMGTDAQGNAKHFIWIPRAHGLGMVFGAGPERILRWMDKGDKKDLDGFAMRTMESVLPTSAREAFVPVPTGLIPLWEQISNHNMFTDAPIVPLKEQRFESALQYGNSTSETAKLLGRLGVSPRRVDHLVRGYTGGLGTYGVQLADEALTRTGIAQIPPRPDKGLAAVPVLKTFLRDAGGPGSGSTVDQFYEVLTKAETMKASQKQRADMGIDLRQYTDKEQQLLASIPTLRKVDKTMQGLRGERLKIERADGTSPAEKRRRIDEIDLELTNLARWVFDKPPISN